MSNRSWRCSPRNVCCRSSRTVASSGDFLCCANRLEHLSPSAASLPVRRSTRTADSAQMTMQNSACGRTIADSLAGRIRPPLALQTACRQMESAAFRGASHHRCSFRRLLRQSTACFCFAEWRLPLPFVALKAADGANRTDSRMEAQKSTRRDQVSSDGRSKNAEKEQTPADVACWLYLTRLQQTYWMEAQIQ